MSGTTRTKSRIRLLTEALTASRKAGEALREIDLRSTRGGLRDCIKAARENSAQLEAQLAEAIQEDSQDVRQHRSAV